MRGKECGENAGKHGNGITPAHAGKRLQSCAIMWWARDHPRTCGEKTISPVSNTTGMGSPPHMRGKDGCHQQRGFQVGITPAHAGKSKCAGPPVPFCRDHPRTCGEKARTMQTAFMERGSPPHMRGKVQLHRIFHIPAGITPAHAGKRRRNTPRSPCARDHPRTCGEKA